MDELDERLKIIENRLLFIERKLDPLSSMTPKETPPPKRYTPSPMALWVKENWLVSVGVFFIILATIWFISYAFANDWIGKTGRVVFGLLSGAFFYSTGLWLLKKNAKGGESLIILGEALALLSLFVGHEFYFVFSSTLFKKFS
jgi:hypothetical protein